MNTSLPSLFISHGAPDFALSNGRAALLLKELGEQLALPKAVVILSPHWMTQNVQVSLAAQPETIHDFHGFGSALLDIRYPAAGHKEVAGQVLELLDANAIAASKDLHRGIGHGVWVPLLHLFPEANVPVVQISMPQMLDAAGAFKLGRALSALSRTGVLIVGSGSITHNMLEFGRNISVEDAAYTQDFTAWVRETLARSDSDALMNYARLAPHAARAHPTAEHFLPLVFAFGAAALTAPLHVLDAGMTYQVIGMESYVFGTV